MYEEDILGPDPIIVKPSRGERLRKSISARLRRKETKETVNIQSYKEEKEARERLIAKRRMAKLHQRKMKKEQNTA